MRSNLLNVALSLLGAVLYVVAYDYSSKLWFLVLVAVIPLFFIIEREKSFRQVFFSGFLYGSVAIGGVIIWFWSTYPLSWIDIKNPVVGLGVIFAVWSASSVILGLFTALWAVLLKAAGEGGFFRAAFTAASLWVLLEFARAFVFSLLWLGKESFVGPYWTFGFLGYPAAWSSVLVPFAPLGGVYLVGFIAVLLNYFFFISLRTFLVKRDRRPLIVPVVFFVALVGVNFFPDTKDDHIRKADIKIAAVSTNFPDTGFAGEGLLSSVRREDALKKLLNEAVSKEPDVVIFPEGSNLAGYLSAEVLGGAFASGRKLTILDSRSKVGGNKEGGITSELLAINGDSPAEVFYEKKFLMPHGEYLPYVDISVAGIFGQKDWINNFVLSRGYKAGDTVKPYYGKEYSIGALFCSEVIPESLHRELAKSGAEFFVNVASQADFHGSNVLYNQTLSLAKMKAASNGKYFVEAGNFVPSFVLDDKGSILAESKRGEDGVLTAEIKLNRSQTPYTRFGNWILWVSMLIVLYGIVRRMTPR